MRSSGQLRSLIQYLQASKFFLWSIVHSRSSVWFTTSSILVLSYYFFFFTEIILFLYNFHIALCQSWELWILLHWGYGAWERIPPHMEVVTIIAFLRLILRDVNCFRMRQTRTHAEKKKCIETTQWSCLWKCHKFQYR